MIPQEQQLITQLSDRLKQAGPSLQKDLDAEVLIKNEIGSQPDALYLLAQAVIMQEQALNQMQSQITMLQQQVNNVQAQVQPGQSKGFLGWLFGKRSDIANQPAPQPNYYQQPMYQQPMYQPYASRGPSFLGSALTTAAGVAGGMFLFEGLGHMFNPGPSMMNPGMSDPFAGQSGMLDQGFGSGDSFMDASSGADTWSNF